MKTCPTCHQTIPEKTPLPTRVLSLLANADHPMPPREIRHALGSGEGTTYQTLRRLAEKGAIRKSTIHGVGTGWALVDQGGIPPAVGLSASDLDEGREMLSQALRDLVSYVASARVVGRQSAVEFLGKLGCDELTAQDIIGLAIQGELLGADEGNLVAP